MSNPPMKIEIAPGAFDGLDQDEIDEIMAEIQALADSGDLLNESVPVDMDELAEEDPELYRLLLARRADINPTLH